MLRYWQFTEAMFEPALPSVNTFIEEQGILRSNLEVDGWQEQLPPTPGSAYAGLVEAISRVSRHSRAIGFFAMPRLPGTASGGQSSGPTGTTVMRCAPDSVRATSAAT